MMLLFSTILIGQFIGLLMWQICQLITKLPATSVRSDRDKPPFGFHIFRTLIHFIAHFGLGWVPDTYLRAISVRLQSAGMEFSVDASEFLAAKCLCLILFTGVVSSLFPVLGTVAISLVLIASLVGWRYPDVWLKRKIASRQSQILSSLPFYLDVITLSIESGNNLTSGLKQAVQRTSDSPLRQEISRVLREVRAGKLRAEALREFAQRTAEPIVIHIISGLAQAERSGASLAPMLRAQAEQLRTQRFQRAEKKAMEAPVKLLAPLFLFIFPSTFVVLGFLIVSKAIKGGVLTWAPLVWAFYWPGVKG